MEIDLMLPLSASARDRVAGELTDADAARLLKGEREGVVGAVVRLSLRHQALARAVALGTMSEAALAATYGLEVETIKFLKKDPAFQSLVTTYARGEEEVFYTTQERLRDLTHKAVEKLEEKLDDPEAFKKMSAGQILDIVTAGADRTGNGPQTSSVTVNLNANLADRMKAARERAREASGMVIDGRAA
jgi:predicted lipid-binding transport protein (Tim44 family)